MLLLRTRKPWKCFAEFLPSSKKIKRSVHFQGKKEVTFFSKLKEKTKELN